jgi:hypothetical protein
MEKKKENFPKNSSEAKDWIEKALTSRCMCCGLNKNRMEMECLPCWHGICLKCFRDIARKEDSCCLVCGKKIPFITRYLALSDFQPD